MVRHRLLLIAIAAALASVQPVAAQFGTIFGGPPRPPGDIPQSGPPGGDDRYFSAQPQQRWTREPRVVSPPPQGYPQQGYPQQQGYPPPPPGYPQQGYPQQQGYPPPPGYPQQAGRPPGGGYQQQELPPPPGATAAPPPQGQPGQPPAAALPGLPPGQRQPRGQPGDTPSTPAPPNDEVVIGPPAQKIPNTTAVFSGLDKITGRIISFDVALNETVQFGALQVTPRVCYTRPATEASNTDAFLEVDEITLQGEIKRIFSGWMFAASPGLHAVEHPIYDVWLADCKGPQQPAVAAVEPAPAAPPQRQAPRQQPARPKQLPPPGAAQPGALPPPAALQGSPQPFIR
jgi:hypothetical protein